MALVSSKKKDLNLSSYSRLNLKLLKINLKSTENRKFKKLTLFNYVPISPCFFKKKKSVKILLSLIFNY